MPNLATASSAVYFVGTDLLGAGLGLPFSVAGIPSTSILNFNLTNSATNDQVTLTAGTSYAVEFWNRVPTFDADAYTWMRSSNPDPGGQTFAKQDTNNSSTSRNAIAANGFAGGAPRICALALYGAAAALVLIGDYNQDRAVNAADCTVW
jgi:hypothetical protein